MSGIVLNAAVETAKHPLAIGPGRGLLIFRACLMEHDVLKRFYQNAFICSRI